MLFQQFLKTPSRINMNIIRRIATSMSIKSPSTNIDFSQLVLVDVNDKSGYAVLTLNRPPVNSVNLELLMALSRALDQVERNNSRGLIMTSIIPNIFSVGIDLRELYRADKHRLREFWSVTQDCWLKLYGSSYPTAAAINGHNPAFGCFLTLGCEYRAMVKNSKIGISGARLGISIPLPMIYSMRNILSAKQTEQAVLSGKLFSTEDAFKIGLVDEIATDKSDAIAKCENYLSRFKDIPLAARGVTKQSMRRWELEDISRNRERDVEEFVKTVLGAEAQACFEKFVAGSNKHN